jgi:hypothetical protein
LRLSELFAARDAEMTPSLTLASKVIDWTYSNIHRFLASGANQPNNQRVQSLCELALFCWLVLDRNPHFVGDDRIRSCLHRISETYGNPVFFERLFRIPDPLVSQALIAIALHHSGLLPAEDLRIFQNIIDRTNVLSSERLPHRQLELRYILEAGGFTFSLSSYRALYRASVTAKPINPIYVTDFDAYSLTHTLFYCSDFGNREVTGASPEQIRCVSRTIEALLGMYTVRGNWDLVAELLLCCHCVKKTSSLLYAVTLEELIKAQWDSGVVPGPNYNPEKQRVLPDDEKQNYVFEECYHTTLVSGLVGALCPAPTGNGLPDRETLSR